MKDQMLSSKFIILYQLGKGSFSNVYKVKRIKDGKIYALKRVKNSTLKKKDLDNCLNEIRILASIQHPNIISFKESFIDKRSKDLCLIMEYAGGGDLQAKIKECLKK